MPKSNKKKTKKQQNKIGDQKDLFINYIFLKVVINNISVVRKLFYTTN